MSIPKMTENDTESTSSSAQTPWDSATNWTERTPPNGDKNNNGSSVPLLSKDDKQGVETDDLAYCSTGAPPPLPMIPVKEKSTPKTASATTTPTTKHPPKCACGCIPSNILSLFEMAELRRQYREKQKAMKTKDENDNPK